MASIYPWPERWWTNTGRFSGNDLTVTSGSIFVPWASEAKPIASGRWKITFSYTASAPSVVDIKHNPFSKADETAQVGQYELGEFSLSAGSRLTLEVTIDLSEKSQPLWTPQFQLKPGQPDVTFHRIEVSEAPAPQPPPGEQNNPYDKQYVRSWAHAEGAAGTLQPISATSEAGDIAILAYSSQWGNTQAKAPAGWSPITTTTGLGGRSGYVAVRNVSSPSDTQNVVLSGAFRGGARENALLVVLKSVRSVTNTGWTTTKPQAGKLNLTFSQQHGRNVDPLADWRPEHSKMVSGGHDDRSSWSALLGAVTVGGGQDGPQAWAQVFITPKEGGGESPGAGLELPAPPSPELHGLGPTTVSVIVNERLEEVPATMRSLPAGYASIDAMIGTPGFLVAHRGGSGSWAEASLRAYTNSVAYGAGALEVSTHRTKDGIWILVHDQNLQLVDPSAPATPIAQMTWEEVKRYTTKGEPLMRVEEYLDAYASTHITVLDPKYSANQWSELALLLPTDAKSKVIWKSAGDATWLADQWHAAGWKCWGYMYEQHITNGQGRTWSQHWDYIGIPYDASTTNWGIAKTFGKPIWAHICPSKAAYSQGVSNGAAGCMVSGIADVLKQSTV